MVNATLALLHTSPVHVPVFEGLRDEDHPGFELRHLVHEDLLARARAEGPDAVADDIEELLVRTVAEGAGVVLCTCSTIGAVAEARAAAVAVPLVRVDRPMAAAAVAAGRSVAVVATLESTLAPTRALVEEEAAQAGRQVDVTTVLVKGAWERFEADDREGHVRLIADAVDALEGVDSVVLAQASMADAADRATLPVPVISSPRPGLRAAVLQCGGDSKS
ncbi:aspartate/glutamate racemase family protein [Streptomyces sp. BA2]|uniref:aspartate/glutamate racemase family protein n=1 Tax=Streptomyces sp. BA2 TaxID=436595 RepID=UPI001324D1CD|nr:aspartate/glutamate racemase family protein [Streptomyces sp. BA2]MWA15238.1 arylsulfatase [Streptomyces sp. BA2]